MQNIWRDFPFFETILAILLAILLTIAFILMLGGLEVVLFGNTLNDSNTWESIEAPDADLDCWRQKENHNNVVCYPKHSC